MHVVDSESLNAAEYFVDRNILEGRGDKVAILCQERSITYFQISQGVNRFGNALRSLGVRMEERVAMLMLDTEFFPMVFFGTIKIGAVPVCLNTLMKPMDYLYFLNDSRARVLAVDSVLLPVVMEVRHELKYLETMIVLNGRDPSGEAIPFDTLVEHHSAELVAADTSPDDACFWLYSSGSTGKPKGTVHLQHDMVVSAQTYGQQVLKVQEQDICFSAAKLFFAYGLGNGIYFPFSVGATSVLLPDRPTPELIYETIERFRPTLFFGVPTLFGSMLVRDGLINGVRLCISAGEALPAEIFHRWYKRFNVNILDGIGSTEITHIFISNSEDNIRPGSTGKLVPGYEARIVDDQFMDLPVGKVGTLLIKGDSTAACYWNRHEKTKKTMLGEWINTDDKFYMDEEGFFHYVGRTNDMLKVGGIWVSPIEVEACLITHPAVLESAVVPGVDGQGLVKPCAYIVLHSGYEPSYEIEREIKEYVKRELAHYKYPRWIYFVDDLPKTTTGKIKRFKLKERELQRAG